MSRALVLVVLVACSSSSPRTEGPGSGTSVAAGSGSAMATDAGSAAATGSDAGSGSAVATVPTGCPATFADARGACTAGTACTYREGACSCEGPRWCGGMAPPAAFYQQPASWRCKQGGDCPITAPVDGSACRPEGKKCDYTCSCMQVSECTKGVWTTRRGPCKP